MCWVCASQEGLAQQYNTLVQIGSMYPYRYMSHAIRATALSDDLIQSGGSLSQENQQTLVASLDNNMSRRGVGLGAFANRTQATQSYATHGANLRSTHLASLQTQLSVFQSLLHTFALEHSSTIKSNPTFRAEFARMCNTIGVDPLAASNVKGKNGRRGLGEGGSFWTQIMGGDMNDFYFEVAVRVVELCRETRTENGGLIGVEECRKQVGKGKAIGSGLEVSEYDHSLVHPGSWFANHILLL